MGFSLDIQESSDTRTMTDNTWIVVDYGNGSGGATGTATSPDTGTGGLAGDDDTGVLTLGPGRFWTVTVLAQIVGTSGNECTLEVGPVGTPPLSRVMGIATGVIDGSGSGTCMLRVDFDVWSNDVPTIAAYVKAHIISGTATLVQRQADIVDYNPQAGDIVGRNARETDSPTFTGTSTRIISVRAPVKAGRTYNVVATGECQVNTSTANTSQHELRATFDDTEPTTSAALQLGRTVTFHNPIASCPTDVKVLGSFDTGSKDGILRVALCSLRPLGTATCQWKSASGRALVIEIIDAGPIVAADGTVY